MNPVILPELAARWERDAAHSTEPCSGDQSYLTGVCEGVIMGHYEAKRECADALRSLIQVLT